MGRKKQAAVKSAVRPGAPAAVPEEDVFQRRLAARLDELKWLYCELYHNDTDALAYFLTMLRRCWGERKAALRAQDARREADPGCTSMPLPEIWPGWRQGCPI